ncbi:MAG: hypothetical protein ACFE9L_00610 [Candidatus Hodarchaeota archaeon]
MNILTKNKAIIGSLAILLVIMLSCIPTQLVMALSQNETLHDEKIGVNTLRGTKIDVPRLIKDMTSYSSNVNLNTTSKTSNNVYLNPNFAIGIQRGLGEGIYNIFDSLNVLDTTSLTTENNVTTGQLPPTASGTGTPSERNASFTIETISDFTRNDLQFEIQSITSIPDWREIENETAGVDPRQSSTYIEAAQEINITDDYANITHIHIYLQYYDAAFGSGGIPTGTISIFEDSSGEPGIQLGSTTLEDGFTTADIGLKVTAWVTYEFPNPINVTKGKYWLVLNDTSTNAANYWVWYTQKDSNGEDYGEWLARSTHGGAWSHEPFPAGDIVSAIKILPTDVNMNKLTYSSPDEISMTYNTTDGNYTLTSFTFKANSTSQHVFYTNTSVSFDLFFIANFTYTSNPITATSSFLTSNNSVVNWNLTFSTAALNTTYNVRNHTIRVHGIEQDWNGTKIYWNDSIIPEYDDLTNNGNVTWDGDPAHKYTYGNTSMVVNASTLADNVTWYVWFNAVNYLLDFNLSRGGQYLSFPYEANVTDTLGINVRIPTSGGNASYWIEYFDGQPIHNHTDFTAADFTDQWTINDNVSQTTNVNGTYYLQAFWVNSDSGITKVGTMTRSLDVFINTSLSVLADTKVVIGQLFNVTAYYKSVHNNSDVKDAKIWCNSSWTTNVTMNQLVDDSYNASFNTTGQSAGTTGLVTITTQMNWFVNWTISVTVKFIGNSSLAVNETNVILEWRENTTLRIDYNDTFGNPIESAMVTVDGNNAFNINDVYYYLLNTTDYAEVNDYPNLVINTTHPDYVSREIVFNLSITPGDTNISGRAEGQNLINVTGGLSKAYANSSADNLSINLRYYYILANDTLNTAIPNIASQIPNYTPKKESDLTWTIIFNPNNTGSFLINITFSLTNYYNSTFILNLTVTKATTAIYSEIGTSATVYYDESVDFFLLYNNTNYNENITGLSAGDGITLNNSYINFLNRTGEYYWFRLNPIPLVVGSYATNITFEYPYFESSFIIVSFEVLARPTDITGQCNAQALINDSTVVTKYFANSSADSVIINLAYYDVLTTNTLDTSAPLIVSLIPIVSTTKEGDLSWNLTFNPNQTSVFLINITFSLANYEVALFIFHLTINKAQTTVYNSLPSDPTVYYDESFDFFLLYNNTNYNENITGLSAGDGITLNNTNVSFVNRTGEYYWFRLSPTTLPLGVHATNITFEHPYFELSFIIVSFEVLARPTDITGQCNAQALINDSTVVTKYFANSSADSVIINLAYYDVLTTNTLDTSAPLIASLIPIVSTTKEGDLSWNLTFNPNQTGVFLINITFSLANYEDALFIFHLTINKAQTTVYNSLPSDPTVYYDESVDFFLLYNNANYNENITGLSAGDGITLNNTNISFVNRTGEYYWFRLSPTTLPLGVHATNITFEHPYFELSFIIVSFEVLARPTDITGQCNAQALINDSTVVTKYFANSSADSVIINLAYYDVLTTNTLDTSAPLIVSLIPIVSTTKEGDLSWNLTFNPNQTSVFLINITFSLANYEVALFIFHLTINKAQTTIYSSLPPSPIVYYDESFDFFLLYNNTNYNENITGLSAGDGITLNNTYINFLNRTGEYYWFRLSPNPLVVGSYATNITFEYPYFESSFIIVSFEVLIHPTNINGQYDGQGLINDSTIVTKYFANSSADSVIINLKYYSDILGTILDTNNPMIVSLISIVSTTKESDLSWNLTFNPNQTGIFLINITFNLANYEDALFIFHLTINKAQTSIYSSLLPTPTVYYDESLDFYLLYNNTNYNENITGLTVGDGIILNNTNVSFVNRTGEYYWFRLSPTTLPLGVHATNIAFEHPYFESSFIIMSFEVLARPTDITGQYEAQSLINDSTTVIRYFANSSADSVVINLGYYDVLTTNTLDTSAPLIETLIPIVSTIKEGDLSWNLTFNPNQTGIFLINITFSLANYEDALFIFHLTINKAQTTIYSSLPPTPTVYYDESLDFFLLYNNTNYNENITGLSVGDGITLNNTKVSFVNRTGNYYWCRLNPTTLPLGIHATNISFEHPYFEFCFIIVSFEVLARPTDITGQYEAQALINDSTVVIRYFANSSADSVVINLAYYDVLTTNILDTSAPAIVTLIPIISTTEEGDWSWNLTFNPDQTGIFLINITFSLANYEDALFIFHLTINKAQTAVYTSLPSDPTVYYDESLDFFLLYNNTNYNENITGLSPGDGITLNNTNISFVNRTGEYYWFRLSPNPLAVGSYATNITFEHPYFESSFIIVSFEVLIHPTNITGQYEAQALINDSTVVTKYFANSSADRVIINLKYYSDISSTVLDTNNPLIISLIPIISTTKEGDLSWNLTFNPNQTGIFLINITFILANYEVALFIFHLTINKAQTTIYSSLPPTPAVYYDESLDFFLLYNNTNYNENITGLAVGDGITLNNTNVDFLNRTGEYYWLRLSPNTLLVGTYATNITFEYAYFESSFIIVSFEVLSRPTDITGQYEAQALINDSTVVIRYFANSSADSVVINLAYYDVLTSNTLDTSAPVIATLIPIISTTEEGDWSWNLTFNPNQTGVFLINITFTLANYEIAVFIFHLTVIKAQTVIYSSLPANPELPYDSFTDFFLIYNNTNYNENITGLSVGDGITLNNTKISFLNHTGDFYWFRLSPTTLPLGIHTTNITFEHAYFETSTKIIIFNVFNRSLIIDNSLSNPATGQTINLQYGEIYYFNVFINDSETRIPLNSSTISFPFNVQFLGISNDGNHSFSFDAFQIGQFNNLALIFSLENYESITFTISFSVSPTITDFGGGTSPINGSLLGDENNFYYTESRRIVIQWEETLYDSGILDLNPEFIGDWQGFLTLEEYFANGIHIFAINGSKLGLYQLYIVFETENYSKAVFFLRFNITIMPTFMPEVDYQSELIVGQILTIRVENWIDINSNSVPFGEIRIYNGSLPLSYVPGTLPGFPFTLQISTEDLWQGSYNMTLQITSIHGYENQTLDILFELIGRDILITIKRYPEKLVQGEDFTIIAILEYAPLKIGLDGVGAGIDLTSLEGIPMTFLVEILYENGTIRSLTYNTAANSTGVAEFIVRGMNTREAEAIYSITVTTESTASTKASSQTTPSNYSNNSKFEKQVSKNPLQPFYFFIIIIFLVLFIGATISWSHQRSKQTDSKEQPLEADEMKEEEITIKEEVIIEEEIMKEETKWINEFPPTFSGYESELKYLFELVVERYGPYHGQTTLKYLLSHSPAGLSKPNLEMLFKEIHIQTNYFIRKKKSIVITEEGKRIASSILKGDNQE